jgi:signal transduction histidine kinase
MERILVVDDDPDIVGLLSRFLSRQGYDVATAQDGEEAVSLFRTTPVALIVTDIIMPKMDGLEVLKAAKAQDPDIEVVILTGAGVLAHAIMALREGAYDYLLKPLERLEELGEVVQRALEHRRLLLDNRRLVAELREANQRLEEKVALRTANLEEANLRLAEALRVKSEFLANMSHELRTPLNSIIGFSELLEDQLFGLLNEKQQGYIKNILTSGRHLLGLINNLLDFSEVEAGRLVLRPEAIPLRPTLEGVLATFQPQARAKGLTLALQVAEDLPMAVADPLRVTQILDHLLSNAVKFTPEGGTVRVTARRVASDELPVTRGEFVEISVSDTGIGIEAAELPKLFQPFVQLEHFLTKAYQGTGLGLALTKRLVELHGGRIWAESEGKGRGATFTFTLPLAG